MDDDTGMITLPSLAEQHHLKGIRRPPRWRRAEVFLFTAAAGLAYAIWAL